MSEIVKETAEYVEMSDSITLSIVKDGTAATVYTIEPCANFEATGRLTDDASKIEVSIVGDVLVYKKTESEPKEIYDVVSPYWFVLSVGDKNYAGYKEPFNSYENSARIAISKTLDYPISTETNNIPGSATLTVYDGKVSVSNDNTVSTTANQLASLVVPISLNAGAIQKIDTKLGNITETTTSIQGEITQIKQGQGEINLKVQGLGRDGVNMIYGGDVLGLADNKKYSAFQSNQIELKANVTYTVSARMWMNASSSHNMLLVVFDDTWKVLDAFKSFSNTSAQVDGFSFTPNVDVKARVGIYEQYGKGGDPKSYVGVYIDWVRLEKGNLKDDDLKIDSLPTKWTPSLADIEANNLIPDPDFENSTWEMSDGGATRELNNNQKTGTDFMSQYSGDQGTYGIYGLRMKRSGYSGTDNIYDGMQYYIPFQGAGDYTLSVFFKNLGNVALDSEAVIEIHPCGADKTRTRGGTRVAINKSNPAIGYVLENVTRTFPEYETRSSDGKSVKTEWIEVRIFLTKNGDVVVSRLSLAKCSHAIHWNTAALRSTNAVYSVADNLLATGIDIKSHKITATTDNFEVRNNSGTTTFAIDKDGNIVGTGNASFKGTVYASGGSFTGTVTGAKIVGSTLQSSDGTNTTTIHGGSITTNNIAATGGNIGAWTIKDGGLTAAYGSKAYIDMRDSKSSFRLDSNNTTNGGSLLSIYNYSGRVISIVSEDSDESALYIRSNGVKRNLAISTFGNNSFLARVDEATTINRLAYACIRTGDVNVDFDHFLVTKETSGNQYPGNVIITDNYNYEQTVKFPAKPVLGVQLIVIQGTSMKVHFDGNGHSFRQGSDVSSSASSNQNGQWSLFIFDGQYWQCVYIGGHNLW